jgi:hypothetical protein
VTHISRNSNNVLSRLGKDLRQEVRPLSMKIILKMLEGGDILASFRALLR